MVDERERRVEIASADRIAQLEDHPGARHRHHLAHQGGIHLAVSLHAEIEVDFLELVVDLPGIAARQEREKFAGLPGQFQPSDAGALLDEHRRFFFPAAFRGIQPVEHVHVGHFGQPLIKSAPFVGFRGAEQELDVRREPGLEHSEQGLQRVEYARRASGGTVREDVRALEPHQFPPEKRQRLQGGNRFVDPRRSRGGVVRRAVDDLDAELPRRPVARGARKALAPPP